MAVWSEPGEFPGDKVIPSSVSERMLLPWPAGPQGRPEQGVGWRPEEGGLRPTRLDSEFNPHKSSETLRQLVQAEMPSLRG